MEKYKMEKGQWQKKLKKDRRYFKRNKLQNMEITTADFFPYVDGPGDV